MRYRRLGDTDVQVSALGFGTWQFAGRMGAVDQESALRALRLAIDAGVTVIDTAQGYFESEQLIGPVLRQVDRDRIFIVSKVTGDYTPTAIERAIEQSLARLATDHLDLYLVHHWLDGHPLDSTMEAMSRLRERGLTRFIGVSNFDVDQTQMAMSLAKIDAIQPPYSMLTREIETALLPFCREHGIGVITHSSLAKGLLGGRFSARPDLDVTDERSHMEAFSGPAYERNLAVVEGLRAFAADRSMTTSQLAIAWLLREPAVSSALVGAKDPAQLEEAIPSVDIDLSDMEIRAIETILTSSPRRDA